MFIQEKGDAGYRYLSEEWKLKHFDAFCVDEGIVEPHLSRELVMKWGTRRDSETMATCSARVSVIRQFGLYLSSFGLEAYIPTHFYKAVKKIVHVLTDDEIKALFSAIDAYRPIKKVSSFCRLAMEYKVLFRLIYCCGLRISEARLLRHKDVDLEQGIIRILHSKGHKDRKVYLSNDMAQLFRRYAITIATTYNCKSEWVFPAREEQKCLSNVTIGLQFNRSWRKTSYAADCDKKPTVHCLRHCFVVKRMNLWMRDGIPLKEMLPFLVKYLGHASANGSFYYYHQIDSSFSIIRNNDKVGIRVIPEVSTDE
jgi:integrase